jgi:hypothetical protein
LIWAERLLFEEVFNGGPEIWETDVDMQVRPGETVEGLTSPLRA